MLDVKFCLLWFVIWIVDVQMFLNFGFGKCLLVKDFEVRFHRRG